MKFRLLTITMLLVVTLSSGSLGKTIDWKYGELAPPQTDKSAPWQDTQWQEERQDEAAQGVKALWNNRKGLRIQVRRISDPSGRVLATLRYDISKQSTMLNRKPGVSELIERGLVPGGIEGYSAEQVRNLFSETSVRFLGVRVTDDALTYTASCGKRDLLPALELLRAYSLASGWRADAEKAVKRRWYKEIRQRQADIDDRVEFKMSSALAGSYHWNRPATLEEAKAVSFHDADLWLGEALTDAKLTVSIVGNTPNDAMDQAVRCFGQYHVLAHFMMASIYDAHNSLPPAKPLKPGITRVTAVGGPPGVVVDIAWPTGDMYDIVRTRHLDILARCLNDCLSSAIRKTYGNQSFVAVWSTASESIRDDGQIHALVKVKSTNGDQVLRDINKIVGDFARQNVDPKLLASEKASVVRSVRRDRKNAEWWMQTVMPYLCWQPFRTYWLKDMEANYRSANAREIHKLAQLYLAPSRSYAVVGVSYPAVRSTRR
jgi:hypothetical protein